MWCRVEFWQELSEAGREAAEGKGAGRGSELGIRSGFRQGQTEESYRAGREGDSKEHPDSYGDTLLGW